MSKFEYADDAALVDVDAATARVTTLAADSITDGDIAGQEQGHAYPPQDARQLNDEGRG